MFEKATQVDKLFNYAGHGRRARVRFLPHPAWFDFQVLHVREGTAIGLTQVNQNIDWRR